MRIVGYCGKYQKQITKEEAELHGCFKRKKGRRKGKPCRLFIIGKM